MTTATLPGSPVAAGPQLAPGRAGPGWPCASFAAVP